MAVSDHRNNNFDLLRLVAAVSVLFSHSFAAVGASEPSSILDPGGGTWGHVGVLVFFSLSGYLIASSWIREPAVRPYLVKRAFRIFPALAAMTVATALVIGPFVTSSAPAQYFSSPSTWLYPLVKTLLFIPGNVDPPGIFAGNPWVGVNPSLWTLPVEFLCYLTLLVLMLLALWISALSARVLCGLAALVGAVLGTPAILAMTPLAGSALVSQSVIVVAAFFMGAFLYLLGDTIRFNILVAAGLAAVAFGVSLTGFGASIAPLVVPYIVLTLALGVPTVPLGKFRGWDLSYAAYLWGFPVQQVVVYVTDTREPLIVFALAVAIVMPIAALSWRLIERPALRHGRALAQRLARGSQETRGLPAV